MLPTSTIGAGCLLIENEKVLLVKPNYGKAKNHWILPGGFVNSGEELISAALRELKEETGQIGEIIAPFCVRYRLNPSDIYWLFKVKRTQNLPITVQAEELVDAQFFSVNEAITSNEVRPMTRFFISRALSKNPHEISIPKEFAESNFVYFFK